MKKTTKDNKGITIIALIITVIIMLILVSVTTYTGVNSYNRSKVNKFVTQMQLLQTKIDELANSNELSKLVLKEPTTQEQKNAISFAYKTGEITTDVTSKYIVFTKEDILNKLDIEDVQDSIMVNTETREIVSLTGIEYEGTTYYTQYKLPNGQTIINNVPVTRELEKFAIDLSIDGINSVVTAKDIKITNGTLQYKEETDKYWKTVTNYTEKDKTYNISISKSGNYIFRLQDNVKNSKTTEKSMQIKLTNRPKTNSEIQLYNYGENSTLWAYAQKDSINYVWIPRFAYKTDSDTNSTEIKFIKGNSNLSTDNTYIDEKEWTIPSKFNKEDGTKLTGLWVKVDYAKQAGLDMINLLNSNVETFTEV